MRKAIQLLLGCALMLLAGISVAGEKFDGNWLTKLTCPPKGNTEGYTWQFPSVIQNGNFHGEHGTAGQPGYLLIEGKIAEDGSAKLSANGIVASRKYARGITAHRAKDIAMTSRPNSTRQRAPAPGTKASAWSAARARSTL